MVFLGLIPFSLTKQSLIVLARPINGVSLVLGRLLLLNRAVCLKGLFFTISFRFWLGGLDKVLILLAVVSALLTENLIDSFCILIAYIGESCSLFQFDLFVMDHIKKILSLLITDSSVFSPIFIIKLRHFLRGLLIIMSFWRV